MEDMARLALVEQSVKDVDQYRNILYELLHHINHILNNPHDYDLRTIKSEILEKVLDCEAFSNYLEYVGFQMGEKVLIFPKEQTLSKLRMAQAALERKIGFCCGPLNINVTVTNSKKAKNPKLLPANVLVTHNSFLLRIQSLFNDMIKYEDEDLQQAAREHIPLVTLQLMALDRMREHQKKIKIGEIKGPDMSFDMALLMELLVWFKHKFFTWVDRPPCDTCGGDTTFVTTTVMNTETERCRVELYRCACGGGARFARYNAARTLLRTRRGRCGEWANCFALLCRALGYDTRYVYDTTDHVWCEVFDCDSLRWLHVDPCEATLDAPLCYERGWGKSICYAVAVSRDDLQDVTWRYTSDHKEVVRRRNEVSESELVLAIMTLRNHRHAQVSPARRRYLDIRTLKELVDLMVERQPSDCETHGRISGSKAWRTDRGEIGGTKSHTFEFTKPGTHCVEYYTSSDRYRILRDDLEVGQIASWSAGVYRSENVFRKVETDWHQTYLAREEGEDAGKVSWKLVVGGDDLSFDSIAIDATTAVYETGAVDWTVQFDDEEPAPFHLEEGAAAWRRACGAATLSARLHGGAGAASWQHAQLGRQPVAAATTATTTAAAAAARPALRLRASVARRQNV